MKIRLSALTLILVFLMTVSVFAAPSTVAVVGSANESDSAITEDSTANLAAENEKLCIAYEDFEDVEDGTIVMQYKDDELDANGKPIISKNRPLQMNTSGILSSATISMGDQCLNMTVVRLDDGNTVLKASKVYSYSAQWRMITFNLTTTEGTGLTKAFPGKYELKLRYFIDNTDKSKYASITGRIGLDGKYPSTGSGRGIGTGKWNNYTQKFEIKDDGTIVYGTTTQAFTNPIKRLDLVNNYTATASDVLYYIDDVNLTYAASRHVTVNYVDSSGKEIKSFDTLHYDDFGIKLVTAADLELDYDACYTINGKKYYPGQNVKLDASTNSVNVTVSNTRVVYFESFDSISVKSEGSLQLENTGISGITPEYLSSRFAQIDKAPLFTGGDTGGAQKYLTITESGRNVLAMNRFQTGKLYSMYFDKLGCLGDGVYTYIITYKAKGSTVLETASINLQGKSHIAYNAQSLSPNKLPADSDGYRTAKFNITVYTDIDGKRKVLYQPGKTFDFDATNQTGANVNRLMFYWYGEGSTDEIIYLDEVAVEFTPYAPGKVNLKSYRNVAPLGMRFASYVDEVQKNKCTEYGFIATRKVFLENAATKAGTGTYTDYLYMENDDVLGTTTTLITNDDGVMIVGACNYNGVADKIYATDGADFGSSKYLGLNDCVKFFTGVIIGLEGEEQKEETFVVRPYVKIDSVYYYGAPLEASYNEVYEAFNK